MKLKHIRTRDIFVPLKLIIVYSNSNSLIKRISSIGFQFIYQEIILFFMRLIKKKNAFASDLGSKLTAWFALNKNNPSARQNFYREIPAHLTFVSYGRKWNPRKVASKVKGRIYSVNVKEIEKYCLRLLLISPNGVQSFPDLRAVNQVEDIKFYQLPSFQYYYS